MSDEFRKSPFTNEENDRQTEIIRLIGSYTVAVIGNPDTQDLHIRKNVAKVKFGSGVKLRIGNRLFIISAKHCIEGDAENPINSLLFAGTSGTFSLPGQPSDILRARGHPYRDIGYVEVHDDGSPAVALGAIAETHPISGKQQTDDGPKMHVYKFVGHPLYEGNQSPLTDFLDPEGPIPLIARPVPQLTKRPLMLPCRDASEDRYLFEYPEEGVVTVEPMTNKVTSTSLPVNPVGYSGGGIWNERVINSEKKLILPEQMIRLFAIQSKILTDFATGEKSLLAIPIKHCLQLIHTHYQDLRPILSPILGQ